MTTYECLMPHCRAETYRRRDVCDPCWQDRRPQLEAMPELYVMTYALLTPGSRIQEITTIHLAKPDSSMPFSLVAFDTLEHAYGAMVSWAAWLYAKNGLKVTGKRTTGEMFSWAVDTLRRHDRHLGQSDFAGDYTLDIWTVYRRLALQCLPTGPRNLYVACPVCGAATVITRHADEYAACLTCATEWPHSQLPIMAGRAAA